MRENIILILTLLFLSVLFISCDDNGCDTNVNSDQASVVQTASAKEFEGYKYIPIEYSNIKFSHPDNFYDQNIEVELTNTSGSGTIYYTLDGNDPVDYSITGEYPSDDPTRYSILSSYPSEKATVYTGPIVIKAEDTVKATTLKAAIIENDTISPIVVKTYVTGTDVFRRFDPTTLIFVLSSDDFNLEDYVYGVTVEGKMRDDYLKNPVPYEEDEWMWPANWHIKGRKSERNMYVEVFDSSGNGLINQAAGGKIAGSYSRPLPQKSWRLIARTEYSAGNGKFKYPFFRVTTDAYGRIIDKFDRITLRNNADDREDAAVRDEITMRLADRAGFPDTQAVRPAAVFLNSKYYGFSWLHEAYCEAYLDDTYGGKKKNFEIVEGGESKVTGAGKAVTDYDAMYALAIGGLTDDQRFEEFCSMVDIDNLILYYAIQVYIDNKDWPNNNYKLWKYYKNENEEVTSEYLDGKWRFLLFDTEDSLSLYNSGYRNPSLSMLIDKNTDRLDGPSFILKALLEREDMKIKFANAICDLSYGAFSAESITAMLNELSEESDVECMYALNNGYTSQWATEMDFRYSRRLIKQFANNRQAVVLRDVAVTFGYNPVTYGVSLIGANGATAYLNTRKVSKQEAVTSRYFKNCMVPIITDAENFAYWKINDNKVVNEKKIELTSDMVNRSEIRVQLYLKE